MFQLNVLGGLSLHSQQGATPSGVLQKRRIGLLAVLAVAGSRGLTRERIQAYLWPDSDFTRARHALDQLVYATRRALGVDPFITEAGDLRLDDAVITSDLTVFNNALRAQNLEDAVGAYGGRLLNGVHIEESRDLESWIDAEAARIDQAYQKALETLACRASSAKDATAAIAWRRKLCGSDPLSSRFTLALIRELLASGDSTGAIRHARAYQDLVRRELEVEPDPQIELAIASVAPPLPHVPARKVSTSARPSLELLADSPAPATHQKATSRTKLTLALAIPLLLVGAFAVATPRQREQSSAVEHERSREAQEAYLRGLNAWQDRSKTALDTAVVYFRKAIDLDPSDAEAEAGLANAYVMIGYSGYRPGDAMFPKAKAAAQRAIALDSMRAEPYAALGMELTWERDFKSALVAYKKAIELDPKYATGHQWYGILLRILGDIPGSVEETRKAARLDPLSLQIQNNYATFLSASGHSKEALEYYQKFVGEEPDSSWVRRNPWLLTNMAAIYSANHRYGDALRFAQRAVEILPGHPRATSALAGVYRAMGQRDEARRVFEMSDKTNPHYAAYRAMFYAAEGEPDSAFLWFDRVRDWGVPILISLRGLNRIKSDPRYEALLDSLGMNILQKR